MMNLNTEITADTTDFHVLVVDDDARLRDLLQKYLNKNNILVTVAHNAAEARELIPALKFDIVVLDVMMPGEDGVSLARHIYSNIDYDLPVLLLTAKGEADDRIEGLESGAEDYLIKPFEPRELILRLKSILRRRDKSREQAQNYQRIFFGAREFLPERETMQEADNFYPLTTAESKLLRVMLERPGQIFTREELATKTGQSTNDRTIDVQVTRLRKKIEPDAKAPRYLLTIRGEGYVIRPDMHKSEVL